MLTTWSPTSRGIFSEAGSKHAFAIVSLETAAQTPKLLIANVPIK